MSNELKKVTFLKRNGDAGPISVVLHDNTVTHLQCNGGRFWGHYLDNKHDADMDFRRRVVEMMEKGYVISVEHDSLHDYALSHAEAAVCIWEWLIDRNDPNWRAPIHKEPFSSMRARSGMASLRLYVIEDLAPKVDAAYNEVKDRYEDSFDWEFVPAIMEALIPAFKSHIHVSQEIATDAARQVVVDYEANLKQGRGEQV